MYGICTCIWLIFMVHVGIPVPWILWGTWHLWKPVVGAHLYHGSAEIQPAVQFEGLANNQFKPTIHPSIHPSINQSINPFIHSILAVHGCGCGLRWRKQDRLQHAFFEVFFLAREKCHLRNLTAWFILCNIVQPIQSISQTHDIIGQLGFQI